MNNHTRHDIDELESEEDVGELANQCRLLRTRIVELKAERDRLRDGLRWIEDACGVSGRCRCGRPTGVSAIRNHATLTLAPSIDTEDE